ncbi:MAG: peptidoglycan bridge formation glycyltransferase FemA/FemB family protein [Candidatus Portnoybacteria bacterium]|nr:peptidoglycan bridge formation glycyltransferase FemA/FemB family protein [Candidatus Portnoybacteria bacterium]
MDNAFSEKGKLDWNRFVIENSGSFLQSWEWGEFQKNLGRKIWRLSGGDEWAAMIVRHDLPLGKSYLYCPGGPVIRIFNDQFPIFNGISKRFINEIKKAAEQEKAIFLKTEPFIEINSREKGSPIGEPFSKYLTDSGFVKSEGGQRIKKTLVLDLTKSKEELLTEMKQKTRYNVRVAEKHGVKVRISDRPEKDIEYFWQLAKETSRRDEFRLHPREHYKKLFFVCHPEPPADGEGSHAKDSSPPAQNDNLCLELFLAECEQKVIAAHIVAFFGDTATYLHGGSSNEHRCLMVPYLLQWEQIKEAKRRDCAQYDFWGINEEKWPGVTRFKKGFGGREIEYIGAWDYVFRPAWYEIYKVAKKLF